MSKIIKYILGCMLVFVVSGCNRITNEGDDFEEIGIFETVSRKDVGGGEFLTIYHKETKVMYLVYVGYGGQGRSVSITPLLNPDGTPMLYEEKGGK